MTAPLLALAAGGARVDLAPAVGGAIARFALEGVEVMRPMPADALAAGNVRLAASYPLVPYSNRIRDASLLHDGRVHRLARNFGEHPHAIHGVGWQRAWRVLDAGAGHAVLSLEHAARDDEARAAWPWPFEAMQAFALCADARSAQLAVTLTLRNRGDAPFPFGLGFHPFFTRDATTTLRFDAEGAWRNDATQLPVEHVPAAEVFDGHPRESGDPATSSARRLAGADLDNVFTGWRGRAALDTPSRLRVDVAGDSAMRFLVVYAPPGRDFVAVEPVTHETDAFNRAARGAQGTGTRVLPPGAAFSCTMRVTASLAPRP